MTNEELQNLALKVKDKTATETEATIFFNTLTDMLEKSKKDLEEVITTN